MKILNKIWNTLTFNLGFEEFLIDDIKQRFLKGIAPNEDEINLLLHSKNKIINSYTLFKDTQIEIIDLLLGKQNE